MATRRGFTLVELLVVIAVIAILAGLLMPAMRSMFVRSQVSATQSRMRQIEAMANAFKTDLGTYPLVKDDTWVTEFKGATSPALRNVRFLARALEYNGYLDPAKNTLATDRYDDPANNVQGRSGGADDASGDDCVDNGSLNDYLFADAWNRPLIYIHLTAGNSGSSDITAGWSKTTMPEMTTPEHKNSGTTRDWGNAFGRGDHSTAGNVAPAWRNMTDDGSREVKNRRRQLSEYFEIWSAGPDGRFDFGTPSVGGTAESFHDRAYKSGGNTYNMDNFSISKPWDDSERMPWEG